MEETNGLCSKHGILFHDCDSILSHLVYATHTANSLYFVVIHFALDPSINNYTVQTVQCL